MTASCCCCWTSSLRSVFSYAFLAQRLPRRLYFRHCDTRQNPWGRLGCSDRPRASLWWLPETGFSSPAVGGVTQSNCVYLLWSSCDCERLYKFCLDDNTASFYQILPQPMSACCRAFWSVPTKVQSMELPDLALSNHLILNEGNINANVVQKHISLSQWQDLPIELLELVASNLSLVDRIRFPAVCKSWSDVSNPIEHAKVWPWLMYCSERDNKCKMLDPLHGKQYTLQVESFGIDDDRHILRSSKDGWVIVVIWFCGVTFSSNPTSKDCVFFGILSNLTGDFLDVNVWRFGENEWSEQSFEYQMPFPVARNNPVLFRGEFYCLGRKGNLGVFNPSSNNWRILDKPEPIHDEIKAFDDDHEGAEFCYLVELGGELISVFQRNAEEPPHVFKLDEKKMAWFEIEEIGDAVLFLDFRASFAVASVKDGFGNRIYFPRFTEDGKHALFYDLENKMYQPSYYGLKEPLNCVWVVPNMHLDE
uniref:F-box domain-containing protein n=1 Tax=Leersia perrieri TaxID=77586 RepID=A0A0D9X8G3_9ORYZ